MAKPSPWESGRERVASLVGPRARAFFRRHRRRTPPPTEKPAVVVRAGRPEHPFVRWPSYPPPGYLGQLDPAFQAELGAEVAAVGIEDCEFYHCVDLPDGRSFTGPWDLRGGEDDYVGGLEIGGQRVLELGPASGGLTFWMERCGADVVAVDVGFDLAVDLMPWAAQDTRARSLHTMSYISAVQNAWWYTHRASASKAKVVYAPVYDLPADLGLFDVAVFGSILLHLRRPFDALHQAARVTSGAIVVTEPVDPTIHESPEPILRWNPAKESHATTLWWSMNAAAVSEMLRVLGFDRQRLTRHVQRHQTKHDADAPHEPVEMFTVVASRS